jgi:hypothetical protein
MGRPKPKGSVHAAKPTAQQMMLAKKLKAKQIGEKAQEFRPDDSDDELQMYTDAKGDSGDDDDEEEVFDLEGEEEDSDDKVITEPLIFALIQTRILGMMKKWSFFHEIYISVYVYDIFHILTMIDL